MLVYLCTCLCINRCSKHINVCVLCTALSTGVWLLLGLSAFSETYYSDKEKQTGWSYNIGWVAFLLCAVAAVYFIVAGIVRLRCKRQNSEGEETDYQPLQQVESAGTHSSDSSDDDDR